MSTIPDRRDGSLVERIPPAVRAALWMFGTIASFTAMMVAGRELSTAMSTFQILFFRSVVGLLVLAPFMVRLGRAAFATRSPGLHVARNVVHFTGQFGWFYAVGLIPLAQVAAIEFTMPIWVAIFAMLFLGERMTGPKTLATGLGFIGILIILRPGFAEVSAPALVVLGASACYAASIIMVKLLTRTDDARVIVYQMNIIQLVLGLAPALYLWVQPGWADVPWIILVGITGLTAHYTFARALTLADATVTVPLDFLRLPFVAIVAWLLYAEGLEIWVALGAVLIFAGNYYSVRAESRRRPP